MPGLVGRQGTLGHAAVPEVVIVTKDLQQRNAAQGTALTARSPPSSTPCECNLSYRAAMHGLGPHPRVVDIMSGTLGRTALRSCGSWGQGAGKTLEKQKCNCCAPHPPAGPHTAASLTLSKKTAALAGRPQASSGREGQAFQSQPVRDARLRRQTHCFSPSATQLLLEEGPSGSRPHTPGDPRQGRVCTSLCTPGQAAGFSPGAPLEHPPSASLCPRHSQFQWGRAGGMQASNPSRLQLHCQAAVLSSPQLHSHVGTAQSGTPAQPSWGRMGIQDSWWGQEPILRPRWLFLNSKPSPEPSFPCPLSHILGLTDTVAPPWLPRASQPSSLP